MGSRQVRLLGVTGGQAFPGPRGSLCWCSLNCCAELRHCKPEDLCSWASDLCPQSRYQTPPSLPFLGSAVLRDRGGGRAAVDALHLFQCAVQQCHLSPVTGTGHTSKQNQALIWAEFYSEGWEWVFLSGFPPTQTAESQFS